MTRSDKPALFGLAAVAIVVAVLAATSIGPPGTSVRVARETVTAEDGVVQATVTGTGNVEAGTDMNVNFQTSGTLEQVLVSVGQHVNQGQLLARLDSTSAQLSVNQAQESLSAAEDQLTALEHGTATSSGSSASPGQGASLRTSGATNTEFVSLVNAPRKPAKRKAPPSTTTTAARTTATTATSAPARSAPTATTTTQTTTTPSPSSIASAQAAIYQAEANLHSAQQAYAKTSLYAPVSGTVVSLASLSPGDPVSAGNSSSASSSAGSSSSGGGSSAGASGAGSLGGASSGSSGSGSGSSSAFAQIVDTSTLTMTVAFSESDISKVAVGQPATVTMDALSGVELAAHVSSISSVATTSSGVVSYDATLTLDQTDPRVKPGMSASAAVITGQAQGVTVPNQALTGTGSLATVNLLQNGKTVQEQVIVGLRGDTRTQIVSGLTAGQQLIVTITLPALSTQSSSTTPSGTLGGGGRFGGGGFGGGGGLGGGGGAFFRGGGARGG